MKFSLYNQTCHAYNIIGDSYILHTGKKHAQELTPKFLQSRYYEEARMKADVPFLYHHLLECDSSGQELIIMEHDIVLRIPKGAVMQGEKIYLELAVTMYGPFHFTEDMQPISPILWICPLNEDFKIYQPIQIILPHFLTGSTELILQDHQVGFAKANHLDYILQNNQMYYRFYPLSGNDNVQFTASGYRCHGVLTTEHCCFYCIQAKKSPMLTMDATYCLARIESSLPPNYEVHFAVTYFLDTCLQVRHISS